MHWQSIMGSEHETVADLAIWNGPHETAVNWALPSGKRLRRRRQEMSASDYSVTKGSGNGGDGVCLFAMDLIVVVLRGCTVVVVVRGAAFV